MRMIDHRRCRYRRNLGCALKETEAERQECGPLPVGEEAEVADAHEAAREQVQLVHSTSGRSHRKNLVSGVSQTTVNFTERSSLASTGSSSNIDRQIARTEYCLDSVPLFVTQLVRRLKVTAVTEACVAICPSVYYRDHVALAFEGRACCQ